MNILLIGAHPDDIEFGMGAAVPSLTVNHNVYAFVATGGGYDNYHGDEIRSTEEAIDTSQKSLQALGVPKGHIKTGSWQAKSVVFDFTLVETIEQLIHQWSIDSIFTLWHGDHHQDHQAVHKATLAAARRVPNIYGYACGVDYFTAINFFTPGKIIQVKLEAVKQKIKALQMHKGEWEKFEKLKPVPLEDILCARAITHGTVSQTGYAEAFIVYRETSNV